MSINDDDSLTRGLINLAAAKEALERMSEVIESLTASPTDSSRRLETGNTVPIVTGPTEHVMMNAVY